jgi:hypothetical protein
MRWNIQNKVLTNTFCKSLEAVNCDQKMGGGRNYDCLNMESQKRSELR